MDVQTPHRGRGERLEPSFPLWCSSFFFFSRKILPKEYKSTTTITMMRVQLLSAREIQHSLPWRDMRGKIQEKILYLRLFNS